MSEGGVVPWVGSQDRNRTLVENRRNPKEVWVLVSNKAPTLVLEIYNCRKILKVYLGKKARTHITVSFHLHEGREQAKRIDHWCRGQDGGFLWDEGEPAGGRK